MSPESRVRLGLALWLVVRDRERSNTDIVCDVIVVFFFINPANNLSLTLIRCCKFLNPTIKQTLNNAGVTNLLDVVLQDQIFL